MLKRVLWIVGISAAVFVGLWLLTRKKEEDESFAMFMKRKFNIDLDPISGKVITPATAGIGTVDMNAAEFH